MRNKLCNQKEKQRFPSMDKQSRRRRLDQLKPDQLDATRSPLDTAVNDGPPLDALTFSYDAHVTLAAWGSLSAQLLLIPPPRIVAYAPIVALAAAADALRAHVDAGSSL